MGFRAQGCIGLGIGSFSVCISTRRIAVLELQLGRRAPEMGWVRFSKSGFTRDLNTYKDYTGIMGVLVRKSVGNFSRNTHAFPTLSSQP